ncbi:MAG TPA: hypothetical protein DCZ75_02720 [Geobacter sp.]|nr:hypothetical protein [Geobacter sp.]
MTARRLIVALILLLSSALGGCSTAMQGTPLPDGFSLKKVADSVPGSPFAANRDGTLASVTKGGLEITDVDGSSRNIASESASLLCFSPGGSRLAAAMPIDNGTLLRLFDLEGKLLGETAIKERVTSMAWRSTEEVLAASLGINKFTFGSQLISRLYRWDGLTPPLATTLSDVTVRPPVGKMPQETIYGSLSIAVSPYGDEIAFSALRDPPLFTPYLRISTRHMETGTEHEVAKTSVGSGGIIYTPDGESLVVSDAHAMTRKLALPDGKETDAWPTPGSNSALSPSGEYAFLDGRLYHSGKVIATFPPQTRGTFIPDGSGLALSLDGKLYLVKGLQDRPAPPLPAGLDRLLKLRRLRSLGLISEQEYRAQKKKETAK